MDSLRFSQYSKSVSDGFAHCQESFKGNGHDQEAFTGHGDVLDGVEEIREENDVEVGIVIKAVIKHHTQKKYHLNNSKCYQTLEINMKL